MKVGSLGTRCNSTDPTWLPSSEGLNPHKVTIAAPWSLLSLCTKDLSFDDECNLSGNER